ncbi:DoxX-like family protein [Cohnella algarum]|uniref:DoxX-like family protein n=1 Tax=Cohnella algarum TaxID=2044859 RepID=UPI0019670FEA|nr:DoxX-like family protein [Cohnella algarum]MBN2980186.1 DoxX-like family protein [Cohnella algarum]
MKKEPIYVELPIRADMDALWRHTQTPELHERWDLRFSSITYLPRPNDGSPQRFRYRTRIGFGLDIEGTGETKARTDLPDGGRLSTLRFGSEQTISLIRSGGGYWRYKPAIEGVVFSTRFDYETRFGAAGRLFDKLLFRPLFGFATAWSFDLLRLWLERGISPASLIRQALVHYGCVAALSLLWLYQGLVPKLLFAETGEAELLRTAGLFAGFETEAAYVLGAAEMCAALLIAVLHRRRWLYALHGAALAILCAVALATAPETAAAPFGPVPLTLSMLGLGSLAALTLRDLPDAGRCKRKPEAPALSNTPSNGGTRDDIHLSASIGN